MISTAPARVGAMSVVTAAAIGTGWLAASSSHYDASPPELVVRALLAVSFVAVGLVAAERRPTNPIGALLVSVGIAFVAATLELADTAALYSVGLLIESLWIGLLIHTLAIYPTGSFDSGPARGFAALGWIATVALQILEVAAFDPASKGCTTCPDNIFTLSPSDQAVDILRILQGPVLGTAAFVLGAWAFTIRWRSGSTVAKRAMWPVLITGVTALCLIVGGVLIEQLNEQASVALDWVGGAAVLAIPVAIMIGVVRTQIAHARAGELAVRLHHAALEPPDLQAALADALNDSSLTVAYWSPLLAHWVSAEGTRIEELTTPQQSMHLIEHDSQPVAALIYDSALDDSDGLIETVAATAGLALENERLRAELRAQLVELRESRARIVVAEDAERRRLERNLHDGAQQQLLSIGLALRHARATLADDDPARVTLDEADLELRDAIGALRELAQGLHPAVLTESGLRAAIETLARRCPVPATIDYSPDVDPSKSAQAVAFYVVSEALTNTTKHADATETRIEVTQRNDRLIVTVSDDGVGGADPTGSGLVGIADRVAAAGGHVEIHSPTGTGTRLKAEIPCG